MHIPKYEYSNKKILTRAGILIKLLNLENDSCRVYSRLGFGIRKDFEDELYVKSSGEY